MTVKKCCGTCKYITDHPDKTNRYHCVTPPPDKMPYWMNWYTSIVDETSGENCGYYEPYEPEEAL